MLFKAINYTFLINIENKKIDDNFKCYLITILNI